MRASVRPALTAAAAAAAALLLAAAPGDARAAAPPEFFGVVSQSRDFSEAEIGKLRRGGVGSVRFVLGWDRVERFPGTYDWSTADAKIAAIERAGATPVPVLFGIPAWLGEPRQPPLGADGIEFAWQDFLDAAVRRYGPGGTLVEQDPEFEPVRSWQIWNEPNLPSFWGYSEPDARDYVALLRLSALAIGDADPEAELIAAGLSPAPNGVAPRRYLRQLYRRYGQLGLAPDFDQIALNPYADNVRESREQVRRFSDLARRKGGSRPPLMVAEIGWGSGGPKRHPATTTRRKQARKLARTYRLFAAKRRRWRISSVHWYAWRDLPPETNGCVFCNHVGLFRSNGRAKPAWKAYRRATGRRD